MKQTKYNTKMHFVTTNSSCSNSRIVGKDKERGLLQMQQVRP